MNAIVTKNIQRAAQAAVLAAVCAFVGGCINPGAKQQPGRAVIAGVDASQSWRGELGQGVLCISAQSQSLSPDSDRIDAFRVDRTSEEITGDNAISNPDQFQAEMIDQLKKTAVGQGTYPAKFFTAAQAAVQDGRYQYTIELFSDGDNDDQSAGSAEELTRLGSQLAANPHVTSVWFFGVRRENRAYWVHVFAPLGKKLHFCSAGEMTPDAAVAALNDPNQ
jgi:hypothetical protein